MHLYLLHTHVRLQVVSEQQVLSRNTSDFHSAGQRSSAVLLSSTTERSPCSSFNSRQMIEDEAKDACSAKMAPQALCAQRRSKAAPSAPRRLTDSELKHPTTGFDLIDWAVASRQNSNTDNLVKVGQRLLPQQQLQLLSDGPTASGGTFRGGMTSSSERPTKVRFASMEAVGPLQHLGAMHQAGSGYDAGPAADRCSDRPSGVQGFDSKDDARLGYGGQWANGRPEECTGHGMLQRQQAYGDEEVAEVQKSSNSRCGWF